VGGAFVRAQEEGNPLFAVRQQMPSWYQGRAINRCTAMAPPMIWYVTVSYGVDITLAVIIADALLVGEPFPDPFYTC